MVIRDEARFERIRRKHFRRMNPHLIDELS